jgi:nucleoside-diphosphate-sugar epimerase/predicted dehydrogenase
MAGVHIPYILKTQSAELSGVCDRDGIRADEMAQKYGVAPYADLAQMLAEVRPDVVHVLTPPQTHAALAIQALQAGSHVFVEKPLCLSTSESEAIYQAARKAGRLVCVDHTRTLMPMICRARDFVRSPESGDLVHIEYVMDDDFGDAIKSKSTLWGLELPGGKFSDLIPHPLYLLAEFMPGIRVVSVRGRGDGPHGLDELSVVFASDALGASSVDAHLQMSFTARPLEHSIEFRCTRGSFLVDLRNYNYAVIRERSLPGPVARLANIWSEAWQRSWRTTWNGVGFVAGWFSPWTGLGRLIKAFYTAIERGAESPVSPEIAQAVVRLSAAVQRQLEEQATGAPARVPRLAAKTAPIRETRAKRAQNSRVLVTGGTGFIGSHLVERLANMGHAPRVLCRPTSRLDALLALENVELAFGDVRDVGAMRQAMDGIELVYHLASARGGDWADYYRTTVTGTQNVLQAAEQAGVKRIVYVSSMGVLDAAHFPARGSIDEAYPLEPQPEMRGYYSRAKLEAEQLVQQYVAVGKLEICLLRPGLVYGPRSKQSFLSDAGFRVSEGLALVTGLGGRRLRLIYVDNLVDAMLLAGQHPAAAGRLYHIVDQEQPTVREYIRAFRDASGKPLKCVYVPTFAWMLGLGGVDLIMRALKGKPSYMRYRLQAIARGPYCDTTRAREELGWKTRVPFTKAVHKAYSLDRQTGPAA